MAIDNREELTTRLGYLLGIVWTQLADEAKNEAINQALNELGWTLPVLDDGKAYWVFERAKRHAVYITLVTQAERFQYKQIRLQQKFDHYLKLVTKADVDFATALDEDMALIDVGGSSIADRMSEAFMYNPAGFIYDQLGKDLTYDYI